MVKIFNYFAPNDSKTTMIQKQVTFVATLCRYIYPISNTATVDWIETSQKIYVSTSPS